MPQTNLQLDSGDTQENSKLETMMLGLASSLCRKFQDYAGKRELKEQEWRRALSQYEGDIDSEDEEKIRQVLDRPERSQIPTVNITRPKTNVAISRMQDIQFPLGGSYNFDIRPTPVPEGIKEALTQDTPSISMQAQFAEDGQRPEDTPSPKDIAQEMLGEYVTRSHNMRRKIRDDLTECHYGRKARRAIHDLCVLGTTIIKGPYADYTSEVMYSPDQEYGEYLPEQRNAIKPSCSRVDPRYYYPDPSAREPDEINDEFEIHLKTRRELIRLANSPAFIKEQVRKVLEEPENDENMPSIISTTAYKNSGLDIDNRYIVHEYHGELPKELLYEGGLITEEQKDDVLLQFRGSAWFVDRILIRLSLDLLEGAKKSIYQVTRYEEDPNSLFGHGVPYLLRHMQRIINNSFVMLMDNAALTSMPQIVVNQEAIQPAGQKNSDYTLRPGKTWMMTEYGMDVREAMQFVNIPTNSQELANIIDMALNFADVESSIPMMQQGEVPVGNNTMTGLATVMSALNIVQKRASVAWDDNITKPLIEGFYHYNMQYTDQDDIKGDMEVMVGGATERIDSQMRAQDMERLLGIASTNPEFLMQIDSTKAFRELVDNIRGGDVLRSPAEVQQKMQEQQQQEQQPDPNMLKAQASMMTAQTQAQEAQARIQQSQQEFEYSQNKDQADLQVRLQEIEARKASTYAQLQVSAEDREIALMKLASEQNISIEKLKTQLAIQDKESESLRQKTMMELVKQQEEIKLKRELGSGI